MRESGSAVPARRPPGRMARAPKDAPPMRQRILDAAVDLFFRQSYQLTTMKDISDACGITPGAIYNHFPSKDELLYSIIQQVHREFEQEISALSSRDHRAPTEELRDMVAAYVRYHAAHRLAALVANEYHRFLSPRFAAEIMVQRRRLRQAFESVVARGARAGEFHLPRLNGKPSARLATIALGDMSLRVAEWFRPDGGATAEDVAGAYAALALGMLGAARPRTGSARRSRNTSQEE